MHLKDLYSGGLHLLTSSDLAGSMRLSLDGRMKLTTVVRAVSELGTTR